MTIKRCLRRGDILPRTVEEGGESRSASRDDGETVF